ncbi:MAG: fumarylacetoacetate hydrolase family protein [bacterium]|nr:fumarylacetoacetate hydrolase family protein [Acidimicrobiia bacterium]MCY4651246.1 fumarylacetoacetate hydrolase family protein [bacterium]
MRLVTFKQAETTRIGAQTDEGVIDLSQADAGLPTEMVALLSGGQEMLDRTASAVAGFGGRPYADQEVRLLAPILNPPKIFGIGENYAAHAVETGSVPPENVIVFAKYATTIIGPDDPIVLPRISQKVDYEAELGVVIGAPGRNIRPEHAYDHVVGYLPFHDVSARDYQMRTSQWTLGKNFDTFSPMGPALVTADEVPDPHDLGIRCRVSGETLQEANTGDMIFDIPTLVAELSSVMTLETGDVIATGTPPGVGMARTPPRWLRPGDVAEVEIDGIGLLRNPVVAES